MNTNHLYNPSNTIRLRFFIAALLVFIHAFAVRGNVMQLTLRIEENGISLKNQAVRIGSQLRYTDPVDGKALFDVPSETILFEVEVPGKQIIMPVKGIVRLTKDPQSVILISIGTTSEQKAFLEVEKKINALMEDMRDKNEDYLQKSKALLEAYFSENNLVLEQYKIKQFLEIQKEKRFKMEGQLKTIPLLTQVMDHYISRTKDLVDEIDRSKEKVFNDNGKIVQKINKSLTGYNEAYEDMNKSRETILNYVENYWGEGSMLEETRKLLEEALQNIHQMELLISNNLINDINNFNEKRKGRRARAEIQNDIINTSARIRIGIENLDKDKTRIVQKMKEFYKPSV